MSQQSHIARGMMRAWREGQGKRASRGIPEILRALEFTAQQIADGESWKAEPTPISLTRKQVRTAWHRALSQQRRAEHGPPGHSPDQWWDQIKTIADRWGIETVRADWETTNAGKSTSENDKLRSAA